MIREESNKSVAPNSFSRTGKHLQKTSFISKSFNNSPNQLSRNLILPNKNIALNSSELLNNLKNANELNLQSRVQATSSFRSVPREAGIHSRIFVKEQYLDRHYHPRWQSTKPREPSYSFQFGKSRQQISNPIDEHNIQYSLCQKNPLLKIFEQNHQQLIKEHELQEPSLQNAFQKNDHTRQVSLSAIQMNLLDSQIVGTERSPHGSLSFSKQLDRPPFYIPLQNKITEYSQANYDFTLDKSRANDFSIKKGHNLDEIWVKQPSPIYDIMKVDLDKIHPKSKNGYIEFSKFRDHIALRTDRMDSPPFLKLEYNPEKVIKNMDWKQSFKIQRKNLKLSAQYQLRPGMLKQDEDLVQVINYLKLDKTNQIYPLNSDFEKSNKNKLL